MISLLIAHLVSVTDRVLAIAAYYDCRLDRFLIATGVINEGSRTAVALWSAQDGEPLLLYVIECFSYIGYRRCKEGPLLEISDTPAISWPGFL